MGTICLRFLKKIFIDNHESITYQYYHYVLLGVSAILHHNKGLWLKQYGIMLIKDGKNYFIYRRNEKSKGVREKILFGELLIDLSDIDIKDLEQIFLPYIKSNVTIAGCSLDPRKCSSPYETCYPDLGIVFSPENSMPRAFFALQKEIDYTAIKSDPEMKSPIICDLLERLDNMALLVGMESHSKNIALRPPCELEKALDCIVSEIRKAFPYVTASILLSDLDSLYHLYWANEKTFMLYSISTLPQKADDKTMGGFFSVLFGWLAFSICKVQEITKKTSEKN